MPGGWRQLGLQLCCSSLAEVRNAEELVEGPAGPFQLCCTTLWTQERHKPAGSTRLEALVCHYGGEKQAGCAGESGCEGVKACRRLGSPHSSTAVR